MAIIGKIGIGLAGIMLLAGCHTAADNQATATDAAETSAETTAEASTEKPDFDYSWPTNAAAREKGLTAHMEAAKAKQKAAFDKVIAEYSSSMDGPAANALISATHWMVHSETAGLLVLLADGYRYDGGAHGMNWTSGLIWDRKAGAERRFDDLFTDPARAKAAITPAFCAAVDAERLKRRGTPTAKTDLFGECVDPFESTIFPTEVRGGKFTQIGFSLAPYTAGPYSEGQYNLTIPLDATVRGLVKPEYQALFAR